MTLSCLSSLLVLCCGHAGYEESDGLPQNSLKKIRLRYVKTWFVFDLVSSIPIDFFSGNAGPVSQSTRTHCLIHLRP